MDDLKQLMRGNYLQYASYVILDRAIPHVTDGLKPVQRRFLYMLRQIHDGRLHKVMNVAGQTMALHPHGEVPIVDALVNMASKGYLLDRQGNFGNIFTGDPAAAPRYIEARLSPLAVEVLFNADLTEMVPSYDGRNLEPVTLPAKIPLVLLQGADGIAVGMSTRILPHNFVELLEAEIALLEDRSFEVLPDFPTGGIMDASAYEKGRGKVKLRVKIEVTDPKTLVIREICHGTTTESLIHSIDEAAKRGKIKIDGINDYTAEKVEIEIKLPRGHYAEDLIEALYAYTECEVTLHSQLLVIKDQYPWEPTVDEILQHHVGLLQGYLKRELEIERDRLQERIFDKSLERIFIENRLYKEIENLNSYEKIHLAIEKGFVPFHPELLRIPTYEDREKLLNIPIRRISRFDLEKNHQEVAAMQTKLAGVEKNLKQIKKVTILYLRQLIEKYGPLFPRKTAVGAIDEIDRRAIETKQVIVGYDLKTGFVGTKVTGAATLTCTNFDKLLLMFKDGSYSVISIPEKQYVEDKKASLVYVGAADKKTVLSVIYKEAKTHRFFAKRFVVKQFILERSYRYLEEGMVLEHLTPHSQVEVQLHFIAKPKQKIGSVHFKMEEVAIKGVAAKGIRIANREVKRCVIVRSNPEPEILQAEIE